MLVQKTKTPDMSGQHSTLFFTVKIRRMLKLLSPKPGESVLDLGCGNGSVSVELSKYGVRLTALDISLASVRRARELFAIHCEVEPRLIVADVSAIPIVLSNYEKIITADVVEHIEPQTFQSMLRECRRVIKPGGLLVIYTPCPSHIFELLRRYNLFLRRNESHVDLKTMESMCGVLGDAGFAIQSKFFQPSHLPIWSLIERALMRVPFLGSFFRRRICITAIKPKDVT